MKKSLIPIALLLILLSLISYIFLVEPNRLESTFHQVELIHHKRSILIAHVTDIHSDKIGKIEQKLFSVLEKNKPDLIVITGDLATPGGKAEGYKELLKNFKAPLGVFFVKGNWEHWEPIDGFDQILSEAGIVDLTNKKQKISNDLWLLGFDDAPTGEPGLTLLDTMPENSKIIALFHSPIFFDSIFKKINLAFAGHSHGGQFRIPFLGSLWVPEGTGNYYEGWFKKGDAQMYVSRGIGNSILPLRFNCMPEIAFIKIFY